MKACQLLSAGANWLALCHWDHLAATSRWYDKHSSADTQAHAHIHRNFKTQKQQSVEKILNGNLQNKKQSHEKLMKLNPS